MTLRVGEIDVAIVRKKIKHLHLYVKPPNGEVTVSAPIVTTDENVRLFVEENLGWVVRKRREVTEQPRLPERQWVSGETVFVWGERYFLTVIRSLNRQYAVRFSGNQMELEVPPLSTAKSREAFMADWYRTELMSEAVRVANRWAEKTGLRANEIVVQKMTRCWGTCLPSKAKIRLNLLLARRKREALEYVVLHELCHLKYKKHGEAFKALVTKYLPNWREVRKRMNEAPLDFILALFLGGWLFGSSYSIIVV